VLTNIALIQRDDGRVANNSIGLSQLDGALIGLGFGRPTTWVTATAYAINVAVFNGTSLYACIVAHTSGVFATDLAAAKWSLIVDFSTIVTPVQTYATNAAASAAGAAGSATAANSSAVAAAISQAAAAASATSASTTYANIISLTSGRSMFHSATVGGSVNAITVTHTPARAARAAGLTGVFTAAGANTITNPTLVYDGWTAGTLTKLGGKPLAVGDIYGAGHEVEWVDTGTNIEIVNPAGVQVDRTNIFTGAMGFSEQTLVVTAGSAAWDMSVGPNALLNLTGATTLANATNQVIGMTGVLRVLQDGTGGRILTPGANYKIVTDCYNLGPSAEYEYFYKVVAASGANSIELRRKSSAVVGPITIATTSGTSAGATGANGVPTWAKRITIALNQVSTNGTSQHLIRLGVAGAAQTTGYSSSSFGVAVATPNTSLIGNGIQPSYGPNYTAATLQTGVITLVNMGSNTWAFAGPTGFANVNTAGFVAGTVTLSGVLDSIFYTTNIGTDVLDAGSYTLLYEG